MAIFYIVCTFPVNYYIVIGGGVSSVGERIEVQNKTKSKGSFNLTYVSELKGTVMTYALSYIIPTWDRESMSDYKYSESEDYADINYEAIKNGPPVLYINGSKDAVIKKSAVKTLKENLPENSVCYEVQGGGHLFIENYAHETAEVTLEFLKNNPSK